LFTYFGKEVGRFDGEEFDAQSPYARKAAFTRLVAIIRFGTIAAGNRKAGTRRPVTTNPLRIKVGRSTKQSVGAKPFSKMAGRTTASS
jgi:hypothetical protein